MRVLIPIFIFLGLLSSCSKSSECWGDNKNMGIIINSISIDCSPTITLENYVITSDSVYQQTFSNPLTGQTNCQLPSIDFSKETLLGVSASGNCEIKVVREVASIDTENRYHYKVKVSSCGRCKKKAFIDNWVTVPKLPNGWKVTFKVDDK